MDCFVAKNVNAPRNDGFTLAEVLITLVIIGVIAAITVPTLMNNTNKREYVSRLKKAYSTLSQATNTIISEEGTFINWGLSENDNGRQKLYELYKKHLNNAKECGNQSGCWAKNTMYKRLDGSNWGIVDNYSSIFNRLALSDGTTIMFDDSISSNCSASNWASGDLNSCAHFYVDINGARKPNQWGIDLFWFTIKNDRLVPAGCDNNSADCVKSSGKTGFTCACKVLREDAINY